jgi:hypothetical protein
VLRVGPRLAPKQIYAGPVFLSGLVCFDIGSGEAAGMFVGRSIVMGTSLPGRLVRVLCYCQKQRVEFPVRQYRTRWLPRPPFRCSIGRKVGSTRKQIGRSVLFGIAAHSAVLQRRVVHPRAPHSTPKDEIYWNRSRSLVSTEHVEILTDLACAGPFPNTTPSPLKMAVDATATAGVGAIGFACSNSMWTVTLR